MKPSPALAATLLALDLELANVPRPQGNPPAAPRALGMDGVPCRPAPKQRKKLAREALGGEAIAQANAERLAAGVLDYSDLLQVELSQGAAQAGLEKLVAEAPALAEHLQPAIEALKLVRRVNRDGGLTEAIDTRRELLAGVDEGRQAVNTVGKQAPRGRRKCATVKPGTLRTSAQGATRTVPAPSAREARDMGEAGNAKSAREQAKDLQAQALARLDAERKTAAPVVSDPCAPAGKQLGAQRLLEAAQREVRSAHEQARALRLAALAGELEAKQEAKRAKEAARKAAQKARKRAAEQG